MPNLLLISVSEWDTRVAFLEDGRLAEFYVEGRAQNGPVGNVYKGRVTKLLPGMAAAFVDVGLERPAYLFAEDVIAQEDEFFQIWLKGEIEENPPSRRLPPATISDLLHEGQEVLVQVLRGPTPNKGARLTTHISLAGHYLVYMPTLSQLGVSRRINDEAERQRIKGLLEEAAARGRGTHRPHRQPGPESREADPGTRPAHGDLAAPPAQKGPPPPAPASSIRNWRPPGGWSGSSTPPRWTGSWWTTPPALSASPTIWNPSAPWKNSGLNSMPDRAHFQPFRPGNRLAQNSWRPGSWLKSGGYLIIDPTEALTAIDVNTGRFVGRSHLEETLLKTNLEAAREIARQLRLRNIGGLIVIDFIDQEKAANRDLVYQTLVRGPGPGPGQDHGAAHLAPGPGRDDPAKSPGQPGPDRHGTLRRLRRPGPDPDPPNRGLRPDAPASRRGPGIPRLPPAPFGPSPGDGDPAKRRGPASLDRLAKEHQVQVTLTPQPQFARDHYVITHEWPGA